MVEKNAIPQREIIREEVLEAIIVSGIENLELWEIDDCVRDIWHLSSSGNNVK